MKIRTINDFDVKGKTILLRVDMNVPIDPDTKQITGNKRIEDVAITIKALDGAKIVIISHQGRVGRDDFVGMENHAKELEKFCGTKVRYVSDVIGTHAQNEIKNMNDNEIILPDFHFYCTRTINGYNLVFKSHQMVDFYKPTVMEMLTSALHSK